MKTTYKGTALIALVSLYFVAALSSFAATTHLQPLALEVSNRLVTATEDDKPALQKAARALQREKAAVSAQLEALASAARALVSLSNDTELVTAQNTAFNSYFDEAQARLDEALETMSVTNVSKSVSNKFVAATEALAQVEDDTNGVASAARLLVKADRKITALERVLPDLPAVSPASLVGANLVLRENADHAPAQFNVNTSYPGGGTEPFLEYHVDHPEELGLWTYEKTGTATGVLHLDSTYAEAPYAPVDRNVPLTFTRPNGGTFTATDVAGRAFSGTFIVDRPER